MWRIGWEINIADQNFSRYSRVNKLYMNRQTESAHKMTLDTFAFH